jgi:hypothetical protein
LGAPNWVYGGSTLPGWWYEGTSAGWIRSAADGSGSYVANDVRFDDSVPVMQSVSGSYGQPGTSGPCRTVAVTIQPNDPQSPGVVAGAQASVISLNYNATNTFYGQRPSVIPQQGETWTYGFAAATNAGYVPYGTNTTDPGFGNWNSFGLEFHATTGLLGPVMQEVATVGPASGGTAGPNGSISYTCGQNMVKLTQPRLQIALTGGLNDKTTNDASHTCLRFQGPVFHPGTVYKTIYQVKWDAFQQGSFSWWVDAGDGRGYVQYAQATGVSTLWRSPATVDTGTYPQLLNYRKTDTSLPTSTMYYGGFIRGTTMTDVTIP